MNSCIQEIRDENAKLEELRASLLSLNKDGLINRKKSNKSNLQESIEIVCLTMN